MNNDDEYSDIGPRTVPGMISAYTRSYITLPDGRRIAGRRPGRSGVSCAEHLFRDALAAQIGGITEAALPYGRADILTAQAVIEVEKAAKWRHGVRQALAYSAQVGLPPAVALFGEAHRDHVLKVYMKLRDSTPQIGLWWFWGRSWLRITSRKHCRCMSDHRVAEELLKAAARRDP